MFAAAIGSRLDPKLASNRLTTIALNELRNPGVSNCAEETKTADPAPHFALINDGMRLPPSEEAPSSQTAMGVGAAKLTAKAIRAMAAIRGNDLHVLILNGVMSWVWNVGKRKLTAVINGPNR